MHGFEEPHAQVLIGVPQVTVVPVIVAFTD
jgi:hypothetical protein